MLWLEHVSLSSEQAVVLLSSEQAVASLSSE